MGQVKVKNEGYVMHVNHLPSHLFSTFLFQEDNYSFGDPKVPKKLPSSLSPGMKHTNQIQHYWDGNMISTGQTRINIGTFIKYTEANTLFLSESKHGNNNS